MSTSESFVSFAASVAREIEYLERVVKEQQEIIEQLTGTGKPKGYVYMHPRDVADYLEKARFVDVRKVCADWSGTHPDYVIELGGRLVKQSPHIPAITKNIV